MSIPKQIQTISDKLNKSGFESYLVGGCVRDLLLGREPNDWDIATNAKPEEIQKIFPDSVYENNFGTVGVKTDLGIVEITTYRKEGKYTDKRHPDKIKFSNKIEDDLERRDFTINAMAMSLSVIDLFNGQKDLEKKLIRAVGNPEERFNEDALRLMRAVRLAAELDFAIEEKTAAAIKKHAGLLEMVAKERIRDELTKLIMADRAVVGIDMLVKLGLMKYIIPELLEGVDVGQNKHHIYTIYEHNLRALDYAASKNYSLIVRLSALLHDIAKPRTKRGEGANSTFYNHEVVGGRMTLKILDRLRFSKEIVERVTHLVRHHLFYYNVDEVTAAGVRRFLRKAGPENIDDLIKVREADRIGSGVPKAVPYKLRHLLFMIDKVKKDPIDTRMLKIDGVDVMKLAGIEPGPRVGQIMAVLLEEILDEPKNNTKKYLVKRVGELSKLSESELRKLGVDARKKKEEFEGGVEAEIKKKHFVK